MKLAAGLRPFGYRERIVRHLCGLTALLALACSSTWQSHVTFVRPGACTGTVGASCLYTYESVTVDQPGRCGTQPLPAGARLVSCREHRERQGAGAAVVVAFLSPLVIVAVVLGMSALGPAPLK